MELLPNISFIAAVNIFIGELSLTCLVVRLELVSLSIIVPVNVVLQHLQSTFSHDISRFFRDVMTTTDFRWN